jgi:hypothetical protein
MKRPIALLLAILCCCSVLAAAADKDVSAVAKAIEREYGLKHQNLPWIARATMRPLLWGSGVSMSFALFDDQPIPRSVSLQQLDELATKALGPGWNQFVGVESSNDGERTLIYSKIQGKRMHMLIVAAERDETTVLKMKLNASQAMKSFEKPNKVARGNKNKGEESRSRA